MPRRVFSGSVTAASIALIIAITPSAFATDVDGPDDCDRDWYDFGDAPECVPAYPSGVLGKFPTCASSSCVGTQEIALGCPPRSSAPGPTGHVAHVNNFDAWELFFGCYETPDGTLGTDADTEGKTNTPASGFSACSTGVPTDCVENAGGMLFDQDECFSDGSDAGIGPPHLRTCNGAFVAYVMNHCVGDQVYLNILIDMNADGDWNDSFLCEPGDPSTCAYEWAVKNHLVDLEFGECQGLVSPLFRVGPFSGPAWMRLSLSTRAVSDDFPWAGSAGLNGNVLLGGETEDYPVVILPSSTPVEPSSWGRVKSVYR